MFIMLLSPFLRFFSLKVKSIKFFIGSQDKENTALRKKLIKPKAVTKNKIWSEQWIISFEIMNYDNLSQTHKYYDLDEEIKKEK